LSAFVDEPNVLIARLREWARTRTASKPEPKRPGKIDIV
jgi:hypothetical protein